MSGVPVCDSDEEVFFGPVTSKELQKASQLKRRTQFLFPAFDWESRVIPQPRDVGLTGSDQGLTSNTLRATTDKTKFSLSADSLESQSFVTLSDKQTESSKGDYCSALSGNSVDSNSQTSLNDAVMLSNLSEDSLEVLLHHKNDERYSHESKKSDAYEVHQTTSQSSNFSDDSLEDKSKYGLNTARSHSVSSREVLEINSDQSSDKPKFCSEKKMFNLSKYPHEMSAENNETKSGSESGVHDDTQHYLNTAQLCSDSSQADSLSSKHGNALTATYEVMPGMGDNDTYTVGNSSCEIVDLVETSKENIELPKEISADKDGGYLSILSEAALYHAAQLKDRISDQSLSRENQSACSAESLEDKFRLFGIDSGDLEEQQLTNSIMYVTGRESNALYSGRESNTFYTGRDSDGYLTDDKFYETTTQQKAVKSSEDVCLKSETQHCPTPKENLEAEVSSDDYLSKKSLINSLQATKNPLQSIFSASETSGLQETDSHNIPSLEKVYDGKSNEHESWNESETPAKDSSEVSGVHELSDTSENHKYDLHESVCDELSNNDSGASSYAGEMNDTLEEYEMMMKYGVEYILGKKGNEREKKSDVPSDIHSESTLDIPTKSRGHSSYERDECSSQSKEELSDFYSGESHPSHITSNLSKQSSSINTADFQDAMDSSAHCRGRIVAEGFERKILSPLRQVPYNTPSKGARDLRHFTPKGKANSNVSSIPSKLPRVASIAPSRLLHTPSPQSAKQHTRSGTPSSGFKSGLFKKPSTPAIPVTRVPKAPSSTNNVVKSNQKVLENIQSPVGAYIHNSPSPVLVTNIKAKMSDKAPFEREMYARALWKAGEMKSLIPKPGTSQVKNSENVNPNIGCGLPAVKYTRAPCIKLDEATKVLLPKGGDKITKLLDAPSPQVIKHEGRLRVNCGSPQLAARMQSMSDTLDDSVVDAHSVSGDISVCVSKQASRTDTLSHY